MFNAGNELANALKSIGRSDIVAKVMRNESRVTDEREIKKAVSRASVADNVGSPELVGVSEQLYQALNQPAPEPEPAPAPAPAPSSPGADAALLSQHFAGDELLQKSAPAAAATRPEDDFVQPTTSAAPQAPESEAADKQAAIASLVSALEEAKFEPAPVAPRESVAGAPYCSLPAILIYSEDSRTWTLANHFAQATAAPARVILFLC